MTLALRGYVKLPPHTTEGGFDHGDVHAATGRVFIAHTATGSLEVVEQLTTEEGAHTTAFDSQREWLYVFLPRRCAAVVYEEAASPPTT